MRGGKKIKRNEKKMRKKKREEKMKNRKKTKNEEKKNMIKNYYRNQILLRAKPKKVDVSLLFRSYLMIVFNEAILHERVEFLVPFFGL